jgi:hypothetical protein
LTPALASSRSFRDPDATLVEHDGRLIRAVRGHALADFRRMLEDPVVQCWMDEGSIVRTSASSTSGSPSSASRPNGPQKCWPPQAH